MQIVTTKFNRGNSRQYEMLHMVFLKSIALCMPDAEVVTLEMSAPDSAEREGKYGFVANTHKLRKWAEYIEQVDDDVILADCDMLMLQSAEHAFDEVFDIAYTKREFGDGRIPLNGGIIMVRNNDVAKGFIKRWQQVNDEMYVNLDFHKKWKGKYPGMNQAALGYMLEEESEGVRIHAYSTREWNAVETDWGKLQENTVFVHYKGQLRREVFSGRINGGPHSAELMLWHEVKDEVPEIELDVANTIRLPLGKSRRSKSRYKGYCALKKKHEQINSFNWKIKVKREVFK